MPAKHLSRILLILFAIFGLVSLKNHEDITSVNQELEDSFNSEDFIVDFPSEQVPYSHISHLLLIAYNRGYNFTSCPPAYENILKPTKELTKRAGGLDIYLCARYTKEGDSFVRGDADLKVTINGRNPPDHIENNISNEPLDLNTEVGRLRKSYPGAQTIYLWQKVSDDPTQQFSNSTGFNLSAILVEQVCPLGYFEVSITVPIESEPVRLCLAITEFSLEDSKAKEFYTEESVLEESELLLEETPLVENNFSYPYISKLKLIGYEVDSSGSCNGLIQVSEDLNIGAGGLEIYLCVRYTNQNDSFFVGGITDLKVTINDRNPPEGYIPIKNSVSREALDLNAEAGKLYRIYPGVKSVYLWQKVSHNQKQQFIRDIIINWSDNSFAGTACLPGYNDTEFDLNLSTKGYAVRLCYFKFLRTPDEITRDITERMQRQKGQVSNITYDYISSLFLVVYPIYHILIEANYSAPTQDPICPFSYERAQQLNSNFNNGTKGLNIYLCTKKTRKNDTFYAGITDLKVTINQDHLTGFEMVQNPVLEKLNLNKELEKTYLWQRNSTDMNEEFIREVSLDISSCPSAYIDTGIDLNLSIEGSNVRICYVKGPFTS